MDSIHSKYIRADKVISDFTDKNNKFGVRFEVLYQEMNQFIKESKCENVAYVNEMILGYSLLDYFEDVERLKAFHKVEHINSIRIVSYTAFWLLKRKPIQISPNVNDKNLVYINERFVLSYILSFLSQEGKDIDKQTKKGVESFEQSLLYFLKYRLSNVNSLEMIIMSFFGGQIYQEDEIDLSSKISNLKLNKETD